MQTFLFTDIEGSTRLWGQYPAVMGQAIARQERILREAIGARGGTVFNTAGDGLCAVFPEPDRAMAAAVDGQRRLLAEPWDGQAPGLRISVRMALDAGDAEPSGDDFVGPVLNRLHRLMKTGHGGQLLCTESVAVFGAIASEIDLRDLGAYSLRDIPDETRIFQVVIPGLPDAFPPLVTDRPIAPSFAALPIAVIGRDSELNRLAELVRDPKARLLTLIGPGGVGKTTLALALTRQLYRNFPNGACFVDLSAVQDPELVVPAIAAAAETSDPLLSLEDALVTQLRDRSLLLVLDNCEHVVAEAARIVARLLSTSATITILATSRVPLRIRGEWEAHVTPLPLPSDTDDVAANPAVQLFAEHANQVDDRFALNETTTTAVVDICRMVDGLPLAIELAAAWVRVLDPVTLRDRLAEGASMLRSDARDRPERHRTLTSTIDWSYRLLSPDERWAFARLAVFQGGIPFDGALAVLQDGDRASFIEALELIDALVQANLLQPPVQTADGPRFGMLQTLQDYALGTLAPDERIASFQAHARYFASLAASASAHYRRPQAVVWLDRLDANLDNLRVAVTWLASPENQVTDDALQMAIDLWEYFDLRNRHPEARALLEVALDAAAPQPSMLHVRALALLGHTWLSNYEQAETYYRNSINMATGIAGAEPPFYAITGHMAIAGMRGDFLTAISLANDVLRYARGSGRPAEEAQALLTLGQFLADEGETEAALACWSESRDIAEQLGDQVGLAWIQRAEGEMRFAQGDYDEARYLMLQAIDALEPLGERQVIALCQLDVAKIDALRSDRVNAVALLASAVDEIATGGIAFSTWEALKTGAIVFTLVLDRSNVATTLFSAADAWSSATGAVERPRRQALVAGIQQTASTRSTGPAQFDPALPLSLREAIELLQETLRADTEVTGRRHSVIDR